MIFHMWWNSSQITTSFLHFVHLFCPVSHGAKANALAPKPLSPTKPVSPTSPQLSESPSIPDERTPSRPVPKQAVFLTRQPGDFRWVHFLYCIYIYIYNLRFSSSEVPVLFDYKFFLKGRPMVDVRLTASEVLAQDAQVWKNFGWGGATPQPNEQQNVLSSAHEYNWQFSDPIVISSFDMSGLLQWRLFPSVGFEAGSPRSQGVRRKICKGCKVKQALTTHVGVCRFRPRLFLEDGSEIQDHEIIATAPANVQLVILELRPPDDNSSRQMLTACKNNNYISGNW